MSAVVAPLFTAERAGRRLRAFAAHGVAPALPWLALGDVTAALMTTRQDEVDLLAEIGAGVHDLRLRDVVTAAGSVILVDDPSVFRLLATVEAMQDAPSTLQDVHTLFADAVVGAVVAVVQDFPREDASRWMREAWRVAAMAYRADGDRSTPSVGEKSDHG